jgi:serine/threonine protein phosphatase PrpC
VRAVNEDSVLALPDIGVWLVSDGMGGHQGGQFSSQTVADSVAMLVPDESGLIQAGQVVGAINAAHEIIRREAERTGAQVMGATVVALILSNDRFVGLWSGDSRLYRFRRGVLDMLSTDHSVVADLVLAGGMTWDEADHSPLSNQITQAVGVGDDPGLEVVEGAVEGGDRFLLCSDGLTKYTNRGMVRNILADASIERVGEKLLGIALDGGGDDNISLVVVDVA